jgi:hypothetical protein
MANGINNLPRNQIEKIPNQGQSSKKIERIPEPGRASPHVLPVLKAANVALTLLLSYVIPARKFLASTAPASKQAALNVSAAPSSNEAQPSPAAVVAPVLSAASPQPDATRLLVVDIPVSSI